VVTDGPRNPPSMIGCGISYQRPPGPLVARTGCVIGLLSLPMCVGIGVDGLLVAGIAVARCRSCRMLEPLCACNTSGTIVSAPAQFVLMLTVTAAIFAPSLEACLEQLLATWTVNSFGGVDRATQFAPLSHGQACPNAFIIAFEREGQAVLVDWTGSTDRACDLCCVRIAGFWEPPAGGTTFAGCVCHPWCCFECSDLESVMHWGTGLVGL